MLTNDLTFQYYSRHKNGSLKLISLETIEEIIYRWHLHQHPKKCKTFGFLMSLCWQFLSKQIGQSIHKWPASRPYHFKFFKGCLPQISLGPFLNILSQIMVSVSLLHKILFALQGILVSMQKICKTYQLLLENY